MTMYLAQKQWKKLIILGGMKVASLCFKQLLLNIKQKTESLYILIDRERLLSVVVKVGTISIENHLDFHDTAFSVSPTLFKI